MYGLPDWENLGKLPSVYPAPAQVRFPLGRTPIPLRPTFPLVSDGITVQLSTAAQPSDIETLFDLGDFAIAMAFRRLEFVVRGGHEDAMADSYMHSSWGALPGSFSRMFPGLWRSGIK